MSKHFQHKFEADGIASRVAVLFLSIRSRGGQPRWVGRTPSALGISQAGRLVSSLGFLLVLEHDSSYTAAAMFGDLAERCEQLLGEVHEITLLVLARGVELSEGTANPVRARELAELCWRRSQYAAGMNARAVASLVDYFEAHGFDSRANAFTADEPGQPYSPASSSPLKN